jgi:heme-degrading monooxygenase HmoA
MFLVVFRNRKRAGIEASAYEADAARMEELARDQPGFVSFKSYAAEDGEVIALSEWESEEAAMAWRRNPEHDAIQAKGQAEYYESYTLFACADPRIRRFERSKA